MPAYTLDANALIYYADNDAQAIATIRPLLLGNAVLYVPTVVVIEVFSTDISDAERRALELMLGTVQTVPLYEPIARLAADVRRSSRIKLPDAAIAATALVTRSTLITRNAADFKRVPDLALLTI